MSEMSIVTSECKAEDGSARILNVRAAFKLIPELCLMTLHCSSTVFSGLSENCKVGFFILYYLCCFSCSIVIVDVC